MAKKAAAKKTTKAKAATPKKKVAKKTEKKTTKRKKRTAKAAAEIRMRLYWGVFNHAMKPVAKYGYNQRKAAEKKASELSAGGKPQHFVAKMKEPVEE